MTVPVAVGLLYACHKYQVPGLLTRAVQFLKDHKDQHNVLTILTQSLLCGEEDLSATCLRFVASKARYLLETEENLAMSPAMMLRIVQDDRLDVEDEAQVYRTCVRWGAEQCRTQGLDAGDEAVRGVLGEILYNIRFPLMTDQEFLSITESSSVLTEQDKKDVLTAIASTEPHTTAFVGRPRLAEEKARGMCPSVVNRLRSVKGSKVCRQANTDHVHAISFALDRDAHMTGVGMMVGSDVTLASLKLYDENHHLVTQTQPEGLVRKRAYKWNEDARVRIYPVLFKSPVYIPSNETYTLVANTQFLSRTYELEGSGGVSQATFGDTTIKFSNSSLIDLSDNRSSVEFGQFPHLMFLPDH